MDDGNVTRISRRRLLTAAVIGAGAAVPRHDAGAAPRSRARISPRKQADQQITFALTTSDQLAVQPLLEEYTRRFGVEIVTAAATYGTLYTNLNINLTQGTGAYDVVSVDDPWVPRFGDDRLLVNLSELFDKAGEPIDSDFIPRLLSLGQLDSSPGVRAIPWMGNIQHFAWRSDLLDELGEKAPSSWDEMLELATRITMDMASLGIYGAGVRGVPGNPVATGFLPLLRGFGADLIDSTSSEPQLATSDALEAISMLLDLIAQAPPGVDKADHAQLSRGLCSGKIAMSADIWTDQLLKASDPELSIVVGKIEIGPEPATRGVKRENMTGNWLLGIPKSSKKRELALEFIIWFTDAAQQRKLLLNRNVPATRVSVLRDPDVLERPPFSSSVLSAARNARPRTRTPYYRAMEEIFGRYVGQAVVGKRSGFEAMRLASSEIRTLLVREGVLN